MVCFSMLPPILSMHCFNVIYNNIQTVAYMDLLDVCMYFALDPFRLPSRFKFQIIQFHPSFEITSKQCGIGASETLEKTTIAFLDIYRKLVLFFFFPLTHQSSSQFSGTGSLLLAPNCAGDAVRETLNPTTVEPGTTTSAGFGTTTKELLLLVLPAEAATTDVQPRCAGIFVVVVVGVFQD